MTSVKTSASLAPRAVLLADLVGSRSAGDRVAVHDRLRRVLERANAELAPSGPLRVTVGDEYQGSFDRVGDALHAATWLRLALADPGPQDVDGRPGPVVDVRPGPVVDVRHGIGWGTAQPLQADPLVEDGPAWWAAREAVEAVEAESRRPGRAARRTGYRRADGAGGPDPDLVEAALVCQDLVLGSLSSRSVRLLRGLLAGQTQAELAEAEGISASAVSQRVRSDGLASLVDVDSMLRRLP